MFESGLLLASRGFSRVEARQCAAPCPGFRFPFPNPSTPCTEFGVGGGNRENCRLTTPRPFDVASEASKWSIICRRQSRILSLPTCGTHFVDFERERSIAHVFQT